MSLIVYVVSKTKDPNLEWPKLKASYPQNELFGFESWRTSVWGNSVVEKLGCPLIHSLKEQDVMVFDEEILALKKEFEVLLQHIHEVVDCTGGDQEGLTFRIKNGIAAVDIALNQQGQCGVVIG